MISNLPGVRRQSEMAPALAANLQRPHGNSPVAWLALFLFLAGFTHNASAQITNHGHALHFDGTTNAALVNTFFVQFPRTNITVEFWARSTNTTKTGSLFSYGVGGQANAFLIFDHRNLTVWINNVSSVQSGVSLTDGLWHHIAVTWAAASGALQIFKDGALAFSTNHQPGAVWGDFGTLVLGQDQDIIGGGFDPNQAFLGDMDEVRVWSEVRTPTQISLNWTNMFRGSTNVLINSAEPNLKAYWRFNEGVGTVARDATMENTLEQRSGISWVSHAPFNAGTAIDMVNGFVEVPDSPAFNAFPMSFTFWLRNTQVSAFIAERGYTQFGGFTGGGLQIEHDSGLVRASFFRTGANAVFHANSSQPINDGVWHHIAFTVDGYAGRIYVDGILQPGVMEWSGAAGPPTTVAPLRLGSATAFGLKGQMDQVAFWNVALDPIGLQLIMNNRLTGLEPGLVALYDFDEGSGVLAADHSTGGHDGTLFNDVRWVNSDARISGERQIRGRVTSGGSGQPNTLVTAFLPPVAAPPLLPLLDNNTVTSTNTVNLPGTIGAMKVHVNITHPYRGDLELTLIHPDGTEVRLKNSDGTDSDLDVLTTYPDLTPAVDDLGILDGKPVAGNWRLRVLDDFVLDSGMLNSWSLQFGPTPALTDANGNYAFSNVLVGNYTVAPVRDGFQFSPSSRVAPVDRTNVDFVVLSGFISGQVRDNTIGEPGVTISAGPGLSTTTATDGTYRLANLPPGNKTLTATKAGYAFNPGQISNLPLGTTTANFQVVAYPIFGRITDLNSNGVPGVSITASTAPQPGISDINGNYTILAAIPGTVTIVPFKAGVTFSPPFTSRMLGPARSNVNFVAIQSPPTVTSIGSQVIARNGSTGPLRFDVGDAETPAARLQVAGISSNPNLVPTANIAIAGVGAQRNVTVTPATNQFGTAVITLTVSDESGLFTNTAFNLRVNQLPLPGVGLALNLDGVNDVANGPSGIILDKGNYSVEAWVFAPSNSGARTLVSQGGQMTIGLNAAGQIVGSTNWNTGVPWSFGAWHHVALVRDSADTRLYVDGILRASRGSALPQPASVPFTVGALGTSQYWRGAIDELRVWRVARTASEIASNLLVRVTSNEANLGSLWRFDEIFGAVVSNAVSSAGNLTLLNGPGLIQSPLRFNHYITFHGRNIHDVLQGYDADGDALFYNLVAAPTRGTVSLVASNTGAFVYNADGLGDDQFSFSVTDGYSTSAAYPVTIQVLPDTNAPVLSFLADKTIPEDTVLGPLSFTVWDAERQATVLPMFGISSNQTLLPNENIAFIGTGTNRTFSLRPATNQFGTVTVTLLTRDGTHEATSSFTLTVTPVNDPPYIQPLTNEIVLRGQTVTQPLRVSDVDTPPGNLLYNVQSTTLAAGVYAYTCNTQDCVYVVGDSGSSGTGTVTVVVSDGSLSNSAAFQVIVNNPPGFVGVLTNQSTFRNVPTVPIPITLTDVDQLVGNVVLTATSSNPGVVEDNGFAFGGSGANRTLVITPVGGRIGVTTITVIASDGLSQSTRTFQLFVEDGPIFEYVPLTFAAGDTEGIPTAMNDQGQIVGSTYPAAGNPERGVVWLYELDQPTVSVLPVLTGFISSRPRAINNSGDILGSRFTFNTYEMFLYRNGAVLTPYTGNIEAIDINDAGAMLWRSNFASGTYYQNGPTITNLGNPYLWGGIDRFARSSLVLDPFGNVAGGGGPLQIWQLFGTNGLQLINAGPLGNVVIGQGVHPYGFNSLGEIVGWIQDPGGAPSSGEMPFIYNFRTGVLRTNFMPAMAQRGFQKYGYFNDVNDSGEIVGEGIKVGNNDYEGMVYLDGTLFRLRDFIPRSINYRHSRALLINSKGDVAGIWTAASSHFTANQPFVLRRKRWVVGQPIAPPLQALANNGLAFRAPVFEALDGTPPDQVAQGTFWNPLEQRFYFMRPMQGKLSWFTAAEVSTNAPMVVRRGAAVWPDKPQIHVASSPVGLDPVDASNPYRPVAVSYTTAGATLDASTRTFMATNTGNSVVRYVIAPGAAIGATPNVFDFTNYFEVVRTVAWDDPAYLVDSQPAFVGTKVTDPRGPSVSTNSFKSGWTIFPGAPYDGVGAEAAYNRALQTGPIIPVNRDTAAAQDDLVVAFYKKNTLTAALWPDLPVRFSISWPTNVQKLVFSDSDGSGQLPESQYADKRIYNQPNPNLGGFNPNEEHAFLAPTTSGQGVFALRNDLNRPDTSEPFVLLKYRNPTTGEWFIKLFQPVLTDPTHAFTYNGDAGKEIQAPNPVGFFTICDGTTNFRGQAFRDHQGKFYASVGPTPLDLNPQIVMRYWYPLQPGFFYDLNNNGTNDLPVGQCIPWNSIPPGGSVSQPVDVTFRIRWPTNAPILQIGETLLTPKRGLPGIKDWASAQVVFDSLNPTGTMPLTNTARLYDPLSVRVLRLSTLPFLSPTYQFPAEIALQTVAGKQTFSELPYHLRSRLSYDPLNRSLSFQGLLNENVIGEPLLLLNVLSDKERLRIKQLSSEPDFGRIIDALYHLTRNPNGVNVANPGQPPPDQALLVGFTTRYTVRVTNGTPANFTTSIQDFFGTRPAGNNIAFLSTNIVQEPLGDAPKALSAGMPVPPATANFGQALNFTGTGYVTLPPTTFNFPTSGTSTNPLTFECWFRTTTGGVILGQQFGAGPGSPSSGYVPALYVGTDGRLRAEIFWRGLANPITTLNPVNDGNYHHVAVVFDGGVQTLYLDGQLAGAVPQGVGHTQIAYGTSYTYQLGTGLTVNWPSGNGGWFYFQGQIDDVRVWNVARTPAQLQAARGLPLAGGESGLVSYWRFDEPSGAVSYDSASLNDGTIQHPNSVARVGSTVPVSGNAPRYMVLVQNNDPALGSLPVNLVVIAVNGGPFRGDLKVIAPDNVFDERLTLRHSSDFGAEPDRLEFEWWYHPDNADFVPTALPTLNADGSIDDPRGWFIYTPALNPNKNGQNTITIGDGGETSQFTLANNWFISRYRGYNIGGQTNWSEWVGDPSSSETTRAMLAEGWVQRVLQGIGFFEARTTNFHEAAASTYASLINQAGTRYEGDIAFNPSPENLLGIGLIEAYTTVLNRGKSLSIDGLPPIDSDPLNNALLMVAGRISDLYMLLGNEAFADAQDPTIGFFSDSLEFGTLATATFAFKNQLDSLLEEELTLLRGRDDSSAGVGGAPVYNRLLWNFTGSDGEVAYERTYNIGDVNLDSIINENDARVLFPQGHGDAWGHYLTAVKTYYSLLRHPRFTWVPRSDNVIVAGTTVRVDFQDERKFANAAAAKAKAGSELVDLTYRSKFVDDPEGQYQGYKDTRTDRSWGVTEWGRRAGQGAYFDWLVGNAILPSTDPNPSHVGIQKIDRQTVQELDQIISEHQLMQAQLDKSDTGLNPLGMAKGAVPFDIDPSLLVPTAGAQAVTHFEQVYDRAVRAMNNCVTIWNQANQLSEALRRQQDDIDDFTANVADQERDYKSRLIEVFGYPYAGDVGAGKTYPSGYDGPDLYHWMYINTTDLTGAARVPTNIVNGYYATFTDGTNAPSLYFSDDLSAASVSGATGPVQNVQFPLALGGWAFAAPPSYGGRRAPGELQLALSDLIQEETRLKIALGNYDALIKNIKDEANLLNSRSIYSNQLISLLSSNNTEQARLNTQLQHAQNSQLALRRISDIVTRTTETLLETVPTDPGEAIFIAAKAVRAGILVASLVVSEALETAADISEGVANQYEKDKENVQLSTDLQAEILSQNYEIKQQAAALLAKMRDEATLRLEAFNQAELVKQSYGRFQAALASGDRLLHERTVFRQRTAAETQQNRYKDMAYRVFRNEALQKYRAQFDLAARFVYLAASAYDYELNFLGSDNRAGRDFFTDIVRQRTIGQMLDGAPIAGSSGLADSLGRLKQNFEVLQPRFGLNNPQLETAQFSLRKEFLRLRDNADVQWRATLRQAVVDNLWDLPEFRRYCRPFAPESAGPQPGLVIRFPSTITFGLNFFGFPLGGGETAYDASLFSTKINSVGVWFTDYNGTGLAAAPRVYLVPAGMDVQRSPTGSSLATREWKILDQVIPIPFPIGSSDLTDPAWIPMNDSLAETFGQIRRFSSFRAYHDGGDYDPAETTIDTRLIGRSVWNSDWILIIPGGTFLFDPEQGLETFINSVSDIKVSLQSYSYSGD